MTTSQTRVPYSMGSDWLGPTDSDPSRVTDFLIRVFGSDPMRRLPDTPEIRLAEDDPFGRDFLWREKIFQSYPPEFEEKLIRQFVEDYRQKCRHYATYSLWETHEHFCGIPIFIATDYFNMCSLARKLAEKAFRVTEGKSRRLALITAVQLCQRSGVVPPLAKSVDGMVARVTCSRWWRRQLQATYGRAYEAAAIRRNQVRRGAEVYATNVAITRRRAQKARNRALLEELEAVNENGDVYSLAELADKSVSNPRNRRSELMVRMAGLEQIARQRADAAIFVTVTCPSRMHRSLSRTGAANPKYDGTRPDEAHRYLCGQWAKTRAKYGRENIQPYGFRIAEPHHDGTPHHHFLLFVSPENRERLCEILTHYAMQQDSNEPGAAQRRIRIEEINYNKGTATGYVAKYVSKNIDGHGLPDDLFGEDGPRAAERIAAWASTWGIRQFQQVGGPEVGVWRELRRLQQSVGVPILDEARAAADAGDFADYARIMGGPTAARIERPIKTARAWSDKPGRYGEPEGNRIIGLETGNVVVPTRDTWTIRRKAVKDCDFQNPSSDGEDPSPLDLCQ